MIAIGVERWSDELFNLLSLAAPATHRELWLSGLANMIDRGDASLSVARRDGAPIAVMVASFQKFPLPVLFVHAVAAAKGTGIAWRRALLPNLLATARRAGALFVRAAAMGEGNRRVLAALGFAPCNPVMQVPV